MPQAHRSRPRTRRIGRTLAMLASAATAAVLTTGTALAEPPGRGSTTESGGRDSTPGGAGNSLHNPSPRYNGDTTGAHHNDPLGYHHTDSNPLLQNEHWQNQRAQYPGQPADQPMNSNGGSAAGWTQNWNQDGSGWTVCPALASHC
ncbi:hypothetical protein [Nocardia sp. NBC_00511]|uniref:hypothetical protein n=1 Tax=Nocardia sp. NBC_00511 TaxID=2903591 RepID=UPI0030E11DA7